MRTISSVNVSVRIKIFMKVPHHRNTSFALQRILVSIVCSLLLILTASLFITTHAQRTVGESRGQENSPSKGQEISEDEVLRIDTDLVHVDVLVTDAEGRPIKGLRPADFKIYEDGVERPLAFFNMEGRGGIERPVAVVFLIDISGSMTPEEMERVRLAMQEFARGLEKRPASFALMSFGMTAKIQQSFTTDFQKINRSLLRLSREPSGLSTHTYDAIDDAIRLIKRDAPRTRERQSVRRAVVVITDGFPVGDTVRPATVIERANAAGVSVYAVTLPSYSRMLASTSGPLPTPLDISGVMEKTGGTSIYANAKDYSPLFKALAEEVTSTYVLAFYPPEEKRRDGRFHTLRVEAPGGLRVKQSRDGYKSASGKQ